jgi:PadR family transcriptional regulator, regulatory protein PadR
VNLGALQRACLPMLVLDVLSVAPRHGYGISQALESAGLQPIRGAQLYPALVRLEDEGAILAQWEQSESGPARKVYVLTDDGRVQRERLHAQWGAFIHAAEALAGTPSAVH